LINAKNANENTNHTNKDTKDRNIFFAKFGMLFA
jgi:hypothetical protein